MMNNQAAYLENVLDTCVTAVLEQGQSVAACLSQYPEHRDVLEPLLRTGLRLQAASVVRPSPEFRQVAAVRMQNLLAAHPRQSTKTAAPRPAWQERFHPRRKFAWAGVLGLVLVFWLFLGGALAYASSDALPGETLYPVKQVVETARLSWAANPTAAARLHLQFAARRLEEAEQLAVLGDTAVSQKMLAAYEAEVTTVLSLLDADSSLTPAEQEAIAQLVATELGQQEMALSDWGVEMDEMDTAVQQALQLSRDGRLTAFQVMGQTPPDSLLPPATPTASHTPTATATATITWTPTATNTATASPTATPEPLTATPTPAWVIPPNWPEGCPVPPDWPEEWPPDCPLPTARPTTWLTPPGGWPIATPLPTPLPTFTVPPDWPGGCPVPPDIPEEWPENCPIPTAWPEGWPTPPGNWPTPPGGWIPPRDWPTPPSGNWQSPPGIPTPPDISIPSDVTIPPPPSWP